MKSFLASLSLVLSLSAVGYCLTPMPVVVAPSVSVSSVSAANGLASVTISTPTVGPYSAGGYTYITHIYAQMYSTGTTAVNATPITCTTTGLQSMALKFTSGFSTGTLNTVDLQLDGSPLQGTIASNVVISCPATLNVIWNLVVTYFQGN